MEQNNFLSNIAKNAENKNLLKLLETIPADISRVLSVSTAQPDTVLAYAGDDFTTVYILLSGTIRLSYELNSEFSYEFASIKPLNILGETECFTNHPIYKASLICHTKCRYISMTKALFLSWMKNDSNALYCMTEYIAQKYTNQVRQDRILLSATGENRFIYLLFKYYNLHAIDGCCNITHPKESLADEICVSVKTISRCIAKLKEEKLISTKGHNLVITEPQYQALLKKYSSIL